MSSINGGYLDIYPAGWGLLKERPPSPSSRGSQSNEPGFVYLSERLIRDHSLRAGDFVEGPVEAPRAQGSKRSRPEMVSIIRVNARPVDEKGDRDRDRDRGDRDRSPRRPRTPPRPSERAAAVPVPVMPAMPYVPTASGVIRLGGRATHSILDQRMNGGPDLYVPPQLVERYRLRDRDDVKGAMGPSVPPFKMPSLLDVFEVNGRPVQPAAVAAAAALPLMYPLAAAVPLMAAAAAGIPAMPMGRGRSPPPPRNRSPPRPRSRSRSRSNSVDPPNRVMPPAKVDPPVRLDCGRLRLPDASGPGRLEGTCGRNEVTVPAELVKEFRLRDGDFVEGTCVGHGDDSNVLVEVYSINCGKRRAARDKERAALVRAGFDPDARPEASAAAREKEKEREGRRERRSEGRDAGAGKEEKKKSESEKGEGEAKEAPAHSSGVKSVVVVVSKEAEGEAPAQGARRPATPPRDRPRTPPRPARPRTPPRPSSAADGPDSKRQRS
eukprot:tig00020610_g12044.t1